MSNSNLREIVRKHQEEQTLIKFLGKKYSTTSQEDKQVYLAAAKMEIDYEVENILNAFLKDIRRGSPSIKKQRNLLLVNLVITTLASIGIAYGVNNSIWIMVILLAIIQLGFNLFLVLNPE